MFMTDYGTKHPAELHQEFGPLAEEIETQSVHHIPLLPLRSTQGILHIL